MRLLRKALFKERAGNTAMIFALLTPVLVLLGGGMVDLTNASMRQSNLQQAADAAAVGAVARSSPAYQAALLMTGDGTVTAANIQSNALGIFSANRRTSGDTNIPNFNVSVQKVSNTITSTVTASGTFTPSFLGLIGRKNITLAVTSTASDNYAPYVNFHLLLDNSPSMAIPAAASDITRMLNMTANLTSYASCAFACHATDASAANQNLSVYASTPTDGGAPILTRIQVVRQSAQQLFTTASNIEQQNGIPKEFQMAVYDFGAKATVNPSLVNYVPLTSDLSSTTSSLANTIDVMTVPSENQAYDGGNGDEDTSLTGMLTQLYVAIDPKAVPVGSGITSNAPQQVIFLVSDGFDDSNSYVAASNSCAFNDGGTCREERPIGADFAAGTNTNICSAIKAQGIQIAVLYTTYLPLDTPTAKNPNPSWYDQYVYPFETTNPTQIAQAMKACASPGLYSEVQPNQAIPDAMNNLFQKVVASVKITR